MMYFHTETYILNTSRNIKHAPKKHRMNKKSFAKVQAYP
jgi:hypothetical protein